MRLLSVIGAGFLALVAAGVGMMGYAAYNAPIIAAEGKSYTSETLPQIFEKPSAANFISFMASDDRAKIDTAEADRFFSNMTLNLGAFQSCDEYKTGGLNVFATPSGKTINATFSAQCYFNKAMVVARVTVKKVGDAWSLLRVDFDSKTMGPPKGRAAQGI